MIRKWARVFLSPAALVPLGVIASILTRAYEHYRVAEQGRAGIMVGKAATFYVISASWFVTLSEYAVWASVIFCIPALFLVTRNAFPESNESQWRNQ